MERISVEQNQSELIISIKAYIDEQKQNLLKWWLILFSICGLIVIGYAIFAGFSKQEWIFVGIYLAFWLYFEYKMWFIFQWRNYGVEQIKIDHEAIHITKLVKDRGIPQSYYFEHVKNFSLFKDETGKVFTKLSDSYWQLTNPAFVFEYLGTTVTFGVELSEKDKKKLWKQMEKFYDQSHKPQNLDKNA